MYELERAERAEKSAGTRWKKRWNALKKALVLMGLRSVR